MNKKKIITVFTLVCLFAVGIGLGEAKAFNITEEITYNLPRGSTLREAFVKLEEKSDGEIMFHLDPGIDVQKSFKLSAQDKTFEAVLNLILQLNELDATRLTNNLYHIYPQSKKSKYGTDREKTTRPYNVKADYIEKIESNLKDIYGRQIKISFDKEEGLIFITAQKDKFKEIERIIREIEGAKYIQREYKLDVADPQSIIDNLQDQYDIKRYTYGEDSVILTHRSQDTESIKKSIQALKDKYIVKTYRLDEIDVEEAIDHLEDQYDIKRYTLGENKIRIKHLASQKESIKKALETMQTSYVTKKYDLSHANIEETIKELNKQYEIKRYIKGENSLIITHKEAVSNSIQEAINTINSRNYQVSIKVIIIEFARDKKNTLGIRWEKLDGEVIWEKIKDISTGEKDFITYPAAITARDVKNNTEIVSSPEIRAENKSKSKITIGKSIPVIEGGGEKGIKVNYKDTGIILETTPHIHNKEELTLDLDLSANSLGPKVSTPPPNQGEYYSIEKKNIQSKIMLKDGHTVIFGGLMREEERTEKIKIPVLNKVPVLGNLFKYTKKEPKKVEIAMLITPKIINIDNEVTTGPEEETKRMEINFDNKVLPYDKEDFMNVKEE